MSLKKYIDEENRRAVFTKTPNLVYGKLSYKQVQDLLKSIECDLSPENLSCDGERPASVIRARTKILCAAQAELENLLRARQLS